MDFLGGGGAVEVEEFPRNLISRINGMNVKKEMRDEREG